MIKLNLKFYTDSLVRYSLYVTDSKFSSSVANPGGAGGVSEAPFHTHLYNWHIQLLDNVLPKENGNKIAENFNIFINIFHRNYGSYLKGSRSYVSFLNKIISRPKMHRRSMQRKRNYYLVVLLTGDADLLN